MGTDRKKATKKKATRKPSAPAKTGLWQSASQPIEDFFEEDGRLKNPQHEIFCNIWLQTFDSSEAIKGAGFKIKKRSNGTIIVATC